MQAKTAQRQVKWSGHAQEKIIKSRSASQISQDRSERVVSMRQTVAGSSQRPKEHIVYSYSLSESCYVFVRFFDWDLTVACLLFVLVQIIGFW